MSKKIGKKIGIYGGSFDPVHLGHINLAVEIMEAHKLDEVWFCPALINPHKMEGRARSPEDRLNMLKLVVEGVPHFRIIDNELRRKGPSYTIDTLHELINAQAGKPDPDHFYLIIGDDAAKSFHRWHLPEEIVKLVPLLIGSRGPSKDLEDIQGSPLIVEAIKKGSTPTRVMDISSTEIRRRLSKKMYCGHLLQGKVLDYILSNQLYSNLDS